MVTYRYACQSKLKNFLHAYYSFLNKINSREYINYAPTYYNDACSFKNNNVLKAYIRLTSYHKQQCKENIILLKIDTSKFSKITRLFSNLYFI